MAINIKEKIMKPLADALESVVQHSVLYVLKGQPQSRPDMPYSTVELLNLNPTNPHYNEESEIDINTDGDYDVYCHMKIVARMQTYGENAMGFLTEFLMNIKYLDFGPITINNWANVQQASVSINNTNEERAFLSLNASTQMMGVANEGYFDKVEGTMNLIQSGLDDSNVFKTVELKV